jgi:GTP cyclohydrolase III
MNYLHDAGIILKTFQSLFSQNCSAFNGTKTFIFRMRYDVLTAVNIHIVVFWAMKLCSRLDDS